MWEDLLAKLVVYGGAVALVVWLCRSAIAAILAFLARHGMLTRFLKALWWLLEKVAIILGYLLFIISALALYVLALAVLSLFFGLFLGLYWLGHPFRKSGLGRCLQAIGERGMRLFSSAIFHLWEKGMEAVNRL